MGEVILFAALGLGAGALTAGLALGIVLTWRGSGVANLAAGAMAMFVAYVYRTLRIEGILFVPPFNLRLYGHGLGTVPAIAVSLLVAAALGAILYGAIFRPLRHAPALAKMIASTGVLLTLQAIVLLRFGSEVKSVPDILPNGPADIVTIAGIGVPTNRLYLAVIVVALAAVLWALFAFTRFGLATTAAAENEKGAILAGLSPEALGLANWMLASIVAGLLGIIASPITQLDPVALTVAVIPALGAALVARFGSFVTTVLAGLGIGVVQSMVTYLQTKDWFPTTDGLPLPGLSAGLPFVIIAIVMFARGRSLPTRATIERARFPAAPRPNHLWLRVPLPAAGVLGGILVLGPLWRQAIILSLIGAVVCLALVVVTGYLGQTSLLHMALAGTAGFVLSRFTTDLGWPLWAAVAVAVVASGAVGAVASLPSLRVQGVNLAIISLAAAVAIQEIYFKNPIWAGGQTGAAVAPPSLGPLKVGPAADFPFGDGKLPSPAFAIFCLVVLLVIALGIVRLRTSVLGQRMLAIRANERAAASAGINVTRIKIIGFAISASIAGVAGVLYAFNFGSVTYTRFDAITAVAFLAFAYLGGISTVSGAMVGGFLVTQGVGFVALQQWFGVSDRLTLLVAGTAVILTVVMNPNGIAGVARDLTTKVAARRTRAGAATAVETAHPNAAVHLGEAHE